MSFKAHLLIASQLLFVIVSGRQWSVNQQQQEEVEEGWGGRGDQAAAASAMHLDQQPAASDHEHHGRVQIKVYRGPDHGHHHFAPHGYWIKQPADSDHHH